MRGGPAAGRGEGTKNPEQKLSRYFNEFNLFLVLLPPSPLSHVMRIIVFRCDFELVHVT